MPSFALLRTYTFRIALGYLGLFGVSGAALVLFVFWSTAAFIERQTDATINAEITGLAETYRGRGLRGLSAIVEERSRNQRQSLYLLANARRQALAGNLDGWPRAEVDPQGWLNFRFERPIGGALEEHAARARHLRLSDGFQLLVGRDVEERNLVTARIRRSLVWALAAILVLGLGGAVAVSRGTLRRLEAINRTSRDIMAGDLTRRIPVTGDGDELARLALNLNIMLDRIERLMSGMRDVSDNIAHDLRTPLNRLRTRIEVALIADATDATHRVILEQTVAEADALIATFNALLAIARAESGMLRQEMETIDLATLVGNIIELFTPAAEDSGITVSTDLEPGLPIRAHRALLSQAISNLLDNAIKYGGERIAVRVSTRDAGVVLSVADEGPGIAAADRENVLERFHRLDASRSSPGSGLGLSLVRAVARLHDAQLVLGDNKPGLIVTLTFSRP
ncbi:MAG: HAMP domain-containing protein [Alphaproteobacteria bacterium]|nr:HAMP domain-containing protein [Alphaproteobacteria bacterium]